MARIIDEPTNLIGIVVGFTNFAQGLTFRAEQVVLGNIEVSIALNVILVIQLGEGILNEESLRGVGSWRLLEFSDSYFVDSILLSNGVSFFDVFFENSISDVGVVVNGNGSFTTFAVTVF